MHGNRHLLPSIFIPEPPRPQPARGQASPPLASWLALEAPKVLPISSAMTSSTVPPRATCVAWLRSAAGSGAGVLVGGRRDRT